MLREIAREARAAGAEGESATLPLKIERSVRSGRTRSRRARLSDLPLESLRVPPDMNANVALLEPEAQAAPCAEKLSEINESLRARERLLTASATASRLLLEAPDVRAAIPRVLGLIGVVAFDNTRQQRAIDASELAALETAAGVIGAALHRERLVDDVRRARERAAEERVAGLATANAVIRANLERLAGQTDLHSFMGHMLLEATRQFNAVSGAVIVLKDSLQQWRIVAHVRDGQLGQPPFAASVPVSGSSFTARFAELREPLYLEIARQETEIWPGVLAFHRSEGAVGTVVYPLVFGARSVGFLVLTFQRNAEDVQKSELLVALAQQATLAVQLTRLAYSAKEAAVLMERTRIGQEIHDGLAQSFTGILLQLGAVEEFPSCKKRGSELAVTLSRIRELARDGLTEARRSVMALRLDQTRRPGLEIALRQLADRSTVPGGVTCTFEGGGIATGLRPEHEHELLRIAQEAVSNEIGRAHPHTVRITMTDEPAHWELAVADDGVGMLERPDVYAREGFGLSSMRQRAGAIDRKSTRLNSS